MLLAVITGVGEWVRGWGEGKLLEWWLQAYKGCSGLKMKLSNLPELIARLPPTGSLHAAL